MTEARLTTIAIRYTSAASAPSVCRPLGVWSGVWSVGPSNADYSSVIQAPNLPWLSERNVRQELETTLGKKVVVDLRDVFD
jgi:hypothetical protein